MQHFLRASFLLSFGFLAACASKTTSSEILNLPPKAPPVAEGKVLQNHLTKGFTGLSGKKVKAFVVFNLPDGYLIRAKTKINPPDYAIKEVVDLQEERVSWLNESLVVNCNECFDLQADPPIKVLEERDLLRLIDRTSLRQEPTATDWATLVAASPAADYIWLIFGAEDYEQKRGPLLSYGILSAWSQSEVHLRSFLYDRNAKKLVHSAIVHARDFDVSVFPLPDELQTEKGRKASENLQKLEDLSVLEPEGSDYDALQYDQTYVYPDIPDSPTMIQKAFLKLTEMMSQ